MNCWLCCYVIRLSFDWALEVCMKGRDSAKCAGVATAAPAAPAAAVPVPAAKSGSEQTPVLKRIKPGASLAAILSGGPVYRCGCLPSAILGTVAASLKGRSNICLSLEVSKTNHLMATRCQDFKSLLCGSGRL